MEMQLWSPDRHCKGLGRTQVEHVVTVCQQDPMTIEFYKHMKFCVFSSLKQISSRRLQRTYLRHCSSMDGINLQQSTTLSSFSSAPSFYALCVRLWIYLHMRLLLLRYAYLFYIYRFKLVCLQSGRFIDNNKALLAFLVKYCTAK